MLHVLYLCCTQSLAINYHVWLVRISCLVGQDIRPHSKTGAPLDAANKAVCCSIRFLHTRSTLTSSIFDGLVNIGDCCHLICQQVLHSALLSILLAPLGNSPLQCQLPLVHNGQVRLLPTLLLLYQRCSGLLLHQHLATSYMVVTVTLFIKLLSAICGCQRGCNA